MRKSPAILAPASILTIEQPRIHSIISAHAKKPTQICSLAVLQTVATKTSLPRRKRRPRTPESDRRATRSTWRARVRVSRQTRRCSARSTRVASRPLGAPSWRPLWWRCSSSPRACTGSWWGSCHRGRLRRTKHSQRLGVGRPVGVCGCSISSNSSTCSSSSRQV